MFVFFFFCLANVPNEPRARGDIIAQTIGRDGSIWMLAGSSNSPAPDGVPVRAMLYRLTQSGATTMDRVTLKRVNVRTTLDAGDDD